MFTEEEITKIYAEASSMRDFTLYLNFAIKDKIRKKQIEEAKKGPKIRHRTFLHTGGGLF